MQDEAPSAVASAIAPSFATMFPVPPVLPVLPVHPRTLWSTPHCLQVFVLSAKKIQQRGYQVGGATRTMNG